MHLTNLKIIVSIGWREYPLGVCMDLHAQAQRRLSNAQQHRSALTTYPIMQQARDLDMILLYFCMHARTFGQVRTYVVVGARVWCRRPSMHALHTHQCLPFFNLYVYILLTISLALS